MACSVAEVAACADGSSAGRPRKKKSHQEQFLTGLCEKPVHLQFLQLALTGCKKLK